MASARDLFDGSLTLVQLGVKLAEAIKRADEGTRVELKVLRNLQAAQAAIHRLGRERQAILAEANKCNIRNCEKVEVLYSSWYDYLKLDNVRPQLEKAILQLGKHRNEIEGIAEGLWTGTRGKKDAMNIFLCTLSKLEEHVTDLKNRFHPDCSGEGLATLVPVFDLIERVRDKHWQGGASDFEVDVEKFRDLVREALHDPAHEDWRQKALQIEGLIVDLQKEFSISAIEST